MTDTLLGRVRRVTVGQRAFAVDIVRHPRARRYVLRVVPDGRLRLTVPRGASIAAGMAFAGRQQDWISREWERLARRSADWTSGTELWFRGERVGLVVGQGVAVLGDLVVRLGDAAHGVRQAVEGGLREAAACELPARTRQLAGERGIAVTAVAVRNQRSRWGSCSPRGTIALNWRLIQMPPDVADYVMLHELAHRRHANHSARFWREVDALCAGWRTAERWLRTHGKDLL